MWDFLKKIFSKRDGDVTVVVLDDNEPELSSSFRFQSADMVKIVVIVVAISVLLTTVIFFATPLGSLYQQQQDESLRQDVITVTEKVLALRDSLDARDSQLTDLKRVLVETPDTTFQPRFLSGEPGDNRQISSGPSFGSAEMHAYEMFSRNEAISSDILRGTPAFPTAYPVEGSVTQGFEPTVNHFGIDIAAREHSEFKSIADGTVVSAGWTVNYGYVIYLRAEDI